MFRGSERSMRSSAVFVGKGNHPLTWTRFMSSYRAAEDVKDAALHALI